MVYGEIYVISLLWIVGFVRICKGFICLEFYSNSVKWIEGMKLSKYNGFGLVCPVPRKITYELFLFSFEKSNAISTTKNHKKKTIFNDTFLQAV